MKKLLAYTTLALTLLMSGCTGADAPKSSASETKAVQQMQVAASADNAAQNNGQAAKSTAQGTKLSMQVGGKDVVIALADHAATQRLVTMLPAELSFSDFNNKEKIAYPKDKINIEGAPQGHAPKAGDVCIYVPWGNICIFYHDNKFSSDLVYLGHVEQGIDVLSSQTTDFNVNLTVVR